MFYKKGTSTKISLFWQLEIQITRKSLKARANYYSLWLWNKCCRFLNCSVSILLIRKVSSTKSEQAEMTRNIPMKITLKLPKIIIYTKVAGHVQHNAFCRMFYSISTVNVWNDRLLQPHKSKDVDATLWLHCWSRAGAGIPIPQWYAVATSLQFGCSCCKLAAEEHPISYNQSGWGLDYLEAKVMAGLSLVFYA